VDQTNQKTKYSYSLGLIEPAQINKSYQNHWSQISELSRFLSKPFWLIIFSPKHQPLSKFSIRHQITSPPSFFFRTSRTAGTSLSIRLVVHRGLRVSDTKNREPRSRTESSVRFCSIPVLVLDYPIISSVRGPKYFRFWTGFEPNFFSNFPYKIDFQTIFFKHWCKFGLKVSGPQNPCLLITHASEATSNASPPYFSRPQGAYSLHLLCGRFEIEHLLGMNLLTLCRDSMWLQLSCPSCCRCTWLRLASPLEPC